MLAPSIISGGKSDHKCEGPQLITEAPHTLPKGERFERHTPKAWSTLSKSRAVDHRAGSQEYPCGKPTKYIRPPAGEAKALPAKRS